MQVITETKDKETNKLNNNVMTTNEYMLQAINYLIGAYRDIETQLVECPDANFRDLDTSVMDNRIKQIKKDIENDI